MARAEHEPGGRTRSASRRAASGIPYTEWRGNTDHTVVGDVRVFAKVRSPQLGNTRNIVVYVPPSYATSTQRYPVIYMHDGQNLFDRGTAFLGRDWRVDESMQALAADGIEAIVVGLWHMGDQRLAEYTPFSNWWVGRGQQYLDFVTDTVRPIVNEVFRTRTEPEHTAILGSSLGGLISLYAFFARPDVFGRAGAMSPALWPGHGEIYRIAERAEPNPGRLYLDNGSREQSAQRMAALLEGKGYRQGERLEYLVEPGGEHNEEAWARRFPGAVRFLIDSYRKHVE